MKFCVQTVSVWLLLTFHVSDGMTVSTDRPRVTFEWATGSPFIRVDACERYGYEFCDIGMVAPDDLDCQYFYQCDQGHWTRQQCAPPTYFNVDSYLCEQQMFVTCQDECPQYTGAPFPDPGADPRGPCPGIDGNNCDLSLTYPDKHSCSWYHNCLGAGNMLEQQCADQTVFDLDTRDCITPGSDFNCFPRCPGITFLPETFPPPTTAPSTETQAPEYPIPTQAPEYPTQTHAPEYPTQTQAPEYPESTQYSEPLFTKVGPCEKADYQFCDIDMMAPDDTNCQIYYVCKEGFWTTGLCQQPTLFDLESFACRPEASATCSDMCPPYTGAPHPDPSLEPLGPCPDITGDNCEPQQNYPDQQSCSHYHHCIGAGTILEAPCPENTFYNIQDQQCQAPDADFNCYREC